MKILIEQNNQINLSPLINTLHKSMMGACEIGFFTPEIQPEYVVNEIKPNMVIYHDTDFMNISPIIEKLRCLKVEHVTDIGTGTASYEFSLTNSNHPHFFPAICNDFILNSASIKEKFRSDISFMGPPYNTAIMYMDTLFRFDYPHSVRVYGTNRYYNWRYCGTISDSDICNVYASSTCIPVFNNQDRYDSRFLDAIYTGCIPIVENNEMLRRNFGELVDKISFTSKEEFLALIDTVLENPDHYRKDVITPLRRTVIDKYTWYDVCSSIMKEVRLPQMASLIQSVKGRNVR